MDTNQTILRCINCNSELQKKFDEWLYRCKNCGLDKSLLSDDKYNGENPIGWTESASDFLEKLRVSNAKNILDELSRYTSLEYKKILDIGCAAGWFLNIAEQYKMIATGLEPEVNIAKKGISNGLDIRTASFPDKTLYTEEYDVITFNDVFEHIERPNEILEHVYTQLKNDGLLVINLPSSNGIIFKISCLLARLGYMPPLEGLWQKGYFSPHIYYYSHHNLRKIVEKHGFELIAKSTLDAIRINGLWSRINHNGTINILVASIIYLSMMVAYPFIKYVLPADIMFHIYRKI